jgi:hypothetical protein
MTLRSDAGECAGQGGWETLYSAYFTQRCNASAIRQTPQRMLRIHTPDICMPRRGTV